MEGSLIFVSVTLAAMCNGYCGKNIVDAPQIPLSVARGCNIHSAKIARPGLPHNCFLRLLKLLAFTGYGIDLLDGFGFIGKTD